MRLGLSSYSYTWAVGVPGQPPDHPMTAYELIEEAVRLHVPCVQMADNMPLHHMDAAELHHLHRFATSRRISIEVGTRGLQEENLLQYIEVAVRLDAPLLRVVIDAPGFEPSVEEAVAQIKAVLPVLRQHRIRLAIENHDRFPSSLFAALVDNTDPAYVGICLDSVNSLGAGEGLHEVVSRLAPYTINLHLKDYFIRRVWHKMGFVVEGVPAGEGMLNIPWLRQEIEQYGKCGSAILELWTPPETDLSATISKEKAWVEKSVAFLQAHVTP